MTAIKEKERTFYFNTSKIPGHRKEVAKKESELTEDDVKFLWNRLVATFNESPTGMQIEFTRQLHDLYQQKIDSMVKQETAKHEDSGNKDSASEQAVEVPSNSGDITTKPEVN
jgi:hypothetical protein